MKFPKHHGQEEEWWIILIIVSESRDEWITSGIMTKWHDMTYGWQIRDKYDHWADRGQVGSMGILSGYNASTERKKDIILAMQWFNALSSVSWVQTTGIIMYPGRVLSVYNKFLSHNGFLLHSYKKIILNTCHLDISLTTHGTVLFSHKTRKSIY